jgi:hypothetical protein
MEPFSRDSTLSDSSLWNVYENSEYGEFLVGEPRDKVLTCEMLGQKCTTLDQFNDLIRPYLND